DALDLDVDRDEAGVGVLGVVAERPGRRGPTLRIHEQLRLMHREDLQRPERGDLRRVEPVRRQRARDRLPLRVRVYRAHGSGFPVSSYRTRSTFGEVEA